MGWLSQSNVKGLRFSRDGALWHPFTVLQWLIRSTAPSRPHVCWERKKQIVGSRADQWTLGLSNPFLCPRGGGGEYELYSCLPNTCNINYEVFGSERLYFAYNLRGVVGCGGGLSGVPPLCSFYFTVSSLNELASKLYIYKWKESPLLYKQTPYVYSNR